MSILDRLTASFFSIPHQYVLNLDPQDWLAHKHVVVQALIFTLPMAAFSAAHMVTILAPELTGEAYLVTISLAALVGMALIWTTDSGLSVMLRQNSSWARRLGVASRILFLSLTTLIFGSALISSLLSKQIANQTEIEKFQAEQRIREATRKLTGLVQAEISLNSAQQAVSDAKQRQATEPAELTTLLQEIEICKSTIAGDQSSLSERERMTPVRISNLRAQLRRFDTNGYVFYLSDTQQPQIAQLQNELYGLREQVGAQRATCDAKQTRAKELERLHRESAEKELDLANEKFSLAQTAHGEVAKVQEGKFNALNGSSQANWQRSIGAEIGAMVRLGKTQLSMACLMATILLLSGIIDANPVIRSAGLCGGPVDTYLRALQHQHLMQVEADTAAEISRYALKIQAESVHARTKAANGALLANAQHAAEILLRADEELERYAQQGLPTAAIDRLRDMVHLGLHY